MAARFEVEIEDVAYCEIGGKKLLARLYKPKGAGPFPAVVEVHGGAWTANDRTTNAPIDTPLAASGVVVMAIDFRMPPEAPYPASIADTNLAIRWLRAHARELHVRPEQIGGLGTSSGGHQMMLAAMRPQDGRYTDHALAGGSAGDAGVAFVVLCWPITDPLARYRMAKSRGNDRLVQAHDSYWRGEAAMDEGNPQAILDRGEAAALPPVLVLQGGNDDNVTPDMAERFAAAYRKAGGKLTLETFPGQVHSFVGKDPVAPDAKRAIERIIAFVGEQSA